MRTIQEAESNYRQSISLVPQRYKAGIARADWKTAASRPEARANYEAGVQAAISRNAWGAGIDKVSNEEWKRMADSKGSQSIAQGMTQGAEKYQRNFAPIMDRIKSAVESLPPKSTDPMSNIDARLKPVVMAAREAAGRG